MNINKTAQVQKNNKIKAIEYARRLLLGQVSAHINITYQEEEKK